MPTRVTSGSNTVIRDNAAARGLEIYSTHPMSLNLSRIEDAELAAASQSARFPKPTSSGEVISSPLKSTKNAIEFRANYGARRKPSVKESKAPAIQVLSQSSPKKRYPADSSNQLTTSHERQPRQPRQPRQTSINDISRFSFGSIATTPDPGESADLGTFIFPQETTVDDHQPSPTYDEPEPSSFPVPWGKANLQKPLNNRVMEQKNGSKDTLKKATQGEGALRIGRSNSLLGRKNSLSSRLTNPVGSAVNMGPPLVPPASRARQKSNFPAGTPSNDHVVKAPRKSIGPGSLPQDDVQETSHRRKTCFGQDKNVQAMISNASRQVSMNEVPARLRVEGNVENLERSRRQTTMSFQPPPGLAHEYFLTPSGTPDSMRSLTINASVSPARSSGQSTNTPLSGRRLSVMPSAVHATGLGARTISPTDARRLKRMSIVPNPPPMPSTPPALQPDHPYFRPRSSVRSPSMIPRKSVTPSSSRTTPEANRKSYSSNISNSSSTSYNSFANLSGSSRLSQTISTSRLPTLKNRNEVIQGGGGEEVPPVPAIPKAYESPKADSDQPFFTTRKSSLPLETSSLSSTLTTDAAHTPPSDNGSPSIDRDLGSGRGFSTEVAAGNERKLNAGTSNNRKTLQPLRLPPLNLLPLSTSTAAKITAFYEGTAATDLGNLTPPPKIGPPTTPSTPMTASKVGFFSKSTRNEYPMPASVQRPNSTVQSAVVSSTSTYQITGNSGSAIPLTREHEPSRASRKAVSPFMSSSLPKSSGNSEKYKTVAGQSNMAENSSALKFQRPTGPRSPQFAKVPKDHGRSMESQSPGGSNTPSKGNSLRRKLSLSRNRSSSKAHSITDLEEEIPPKPPKHDQMPPPKLPASATWSGPLLPGSSPIRRLNTVNTKRKASNSNIKDYNDRNRGNAWVTDGSFETESALLGSSSSTDLSVTLQSRELPSTPSSQNLKEFLREAKIKEPQLDRDDLLAEEEMKRLAAKRKDTENAAKEMDTLRKRATAKERVSPVQALRMANLNIFERGEIVDYKDIFFCGTRDAKKYVGNLTTDCANFGYDDERADYNIVKGDHLLYRYEIIDILGKGSFGQVVRCIDHKTGDLVAIKIIRNKKRFHEQALVEVDILQKLKEWDPHKKHSVVHFTQSFYFRGHLCISTELLGMNLYEFIKSHDFRGFSLKLIRRFTKQLLGSLVLLKGHKVIHCDLKPENILLVHPARSEIKVIDFGSSCLENEQVYTYIQSRFYRSPEVILGMTYGMPIDMWSLGCILAELLTGYPIFPGENEQEQLACIMEVIGPPEKHLIEKSNRKKLFFDSVGKPRLTVSSKGKRRRPGSKSLLQVLKCEDEVFLDFISRCLRWDPDRRLKPDEATRHEFVTGTKTVVRPLRPHLSTATSSPVKRYTSTQTPAGTRPLPEPPVTSIKNSAATRTREMPSTSPSKAGATPSRRYSTVKGLPNNAGVKRALNGTGTTGSGLPRVTSRVVSARSDMAMAAATASLVSETHGLRGQFDVSQPDVWG